jgi:hypothetical protein
MSSKSNWLVVRWKLKNKLFSYPLNKQARMFVLYKKATCQFQIKFITDDYLQKYKTLQLFANIKVIKNTNAQTYLQASMLLKMPSALKLGLNKNC